MEAYPTFSVSMQIGSTEYAAQQVAGLSYEFVNGYKKFFEGHRMGLQLPDNRLLSTMPGVTMLRRPAGLTPSTYTPMAGPLKILVAVGAPDEDQPQSGVLDLEKELQLILDSVEKTRNLGNAQVRILEVGHPEVTGISSPAMILTPLPILQRRPSGLWFRQIKPCR